mmetsp:Transcript_7549/g.23255  ORF Transcript_7549/g.23255 Transcript_7549/m.23255 type:complete len:203 (+) Transcript_7549:1993-2601(+)
MLRTTIDRCTDDLAVPDGTLALHVDVDAFRVARMPGVLECAQLIAHPSSGRSILHHRNTRRIGSPRQRKHRRHQWFLGPRLASRRRVRIDRIGTPAKRIRLWRALCGLRLAVAGVRARGRALMRGRCRARRRGCGLHCGVRTCAGVATVPRCARISGCRVRIYRHVKDAGGLRREVGTGRFGTHRRRRRRRTHRTGCLTVQR